MITYNHQEFISKSIEGILRQQVDFNFELVIGEDISSDCTRAICQMFADEYPDLIRLLVRDSNLGIRRNFLDTKSHCRGRYIALCEGDDYWTDPHKLQKQVDFLDQNPEFTICHHRVEFVDSNGVSSGHLSGRSPRSTTFEDLARRQHISTPSCVFRNHLFEFPDVFTDVYGTDYMLHLLNADKGKIGYIDEVMGAYRIHAQGEWSGRTSVDRTEKAIDTIRKCRDYFYPRGVAEFDYHAGKLECFVKLERGEIAEYRKSYNLLKIKHSQFLSLADRIALLSRYWLIRFPKLMNMYSRLGARVKGAFNRI